MDRAPENLLRAEEESEHRQLEGEALIEAQRDRDMFEAEGDESLGRDEQEEESGIGETIPEYLDWEYIKLSINEEDKEQ